MSKLPPPPSGVEVARYFEQGLARQSSKPGSSTKEISEELRSFSADLDGLAGIDCTQLTLDKLSAYQRKTEEYQAKLIDLSTKLRKIKVLPLIDCDTPAETIDPATVHKAEVTLYESAGEAPITSDQISAIENKFQEVVIKIAMIQQSVATSLDQATRLTIDPSLEDREAVDPDAIEADNTPRSFDSTSIDGDDTLSLPDIIVEDLEVLPIAVVDSEYIGLAELLNSLAITNEEEISNTILDTANTYKLFSSLASLRPTASKQMILERIKALKTDINSWWFNSSKSKYLSELSKIEQAIERDLLERELSTALGFKEDITLVEHFKMIAEGEFPLSYEGIIDFLATQAEGRGSAISSSIRKLAECYSKLEELEVPLAESSSFGEEEIIQAFKTIDTIEVENDKLPLAQILRVKFLSTVNDLETTTKFLSLYGSDRYFQVGEVSKNSYAKEKADKAIVDSLKLLEFRKIKAALESLEGEDIETIHLELIENYPEIAYDLLIQRAERVHDFLSGGYIEGILDRELDRIQDISQKPYPERNTQKCLKRWYQDLLSKEKSEGYLSLNHIIIQGRLKAFENGAELKGSLDSMLSRGDSFFEKTTASIGAALAKLPGAQGTMKGISLATTGVSKGAELVSSAVSSAIEATSDYVRSGQAATHLGIIANKTVELSVSAASSLGSAVSSASHQIANYHFKQQTVSYIKSLRDTFSAKKFSTLIDEQIEAVNFADTRKAWDEQAFVEMRAIVELLNKSHNLPSIPGFLQDLDNRKLQYEEGIDTYEKALELHKKHPEKHPAPTPYIKLKKLVKRDIKRYLEDNGNSLPKEIKSVLVDFQEKVYGGLTVNPLKKHGWFVMKLFVPLINKEALTGAKNLLSRPDFSKLVSIENMTRMLADVNESSFEFGAVRQSALMRDALPTDTEEQQQYKAKLIENETKRLTKEVADNMSKASGHLAKMLIPAIDEPQYSFPRKQWRRFKRFVMRKGLESGVANFQLTPLLDGAFGNEKTHAIYRPIGHVSFFKDFLLRQEVNVNSQDSIEILANKLVMLRLINKLIDHIDPDLPASKRLDVQPHASASNISPFIKQLRLLNNNYELAPLAGYNLGSNVGYTISMAQRAASWPLSFIDSATLTQSENERELRLATLKSSIYRNMLNLKINEKQVSINEISPDGYGNKISRDDYGNILAALDNNNFYDALALLEKVYQALQANYRLSPREKDWEEKVHLDAIKKQIEEAINEKDCLWENIKLACDGVRDLTLDYLKS